MVGIGELMTEEDGNDFIHERGAKVMAETLM
jgi:hypothetical protein